MRIRRAMAVLLLLSLLLLSGCWDATSPEQMAWVSALGVDDGPGDAFRFTFQVMIPRELADGGGGGGAGGKGHTSSVFTVEAPDVITAIEMTDAFVARRVTLQHAKALVLGEEVVRHGIARFIAPALRYRDFRRTMYVMVSRGTAKEFLEQAQPRLETDPALYYEMMMHWQQQTNLVPPMRLHELVLANERPGEGARAALVAARPDLAEFDGDVKRGDEHAVGTLSPSRFFAGSLPRAGGIPIEFLGTACFKADKLVGLLTGQQTRMVSLLRGELSQQTPVSFPDPEHPNQPIVILLRTQSRPTIRLQRTGNRVFASFFLNMEGDIGSIPSVTNYMTHEGMQKVERSTSQHLEQNLQKLLHLVLNEWGTDLFELGDLLQVQFPTIQAWEQFDWSHRIKDTQFTVSVNFRIRRHGLQKEPAKPGG